MAATDRAHSPTGTDDVSDVDILFECPSCNKSLVVDESAEGLIVECPQCHISVIVPPRRPLPPGPPGMVTRQTATAPAPAPATAVPPPRPEAAPTGPLHDRLQVLAGQLKELQTQWTEVTNRIASRINEVNRDLVAMARLEASHKQILKEWNQLVSDIAAASQEVGTPPPPAPPATPKK